MAKTVYLYPSNQFGNLYAYAETNEGEQCNAVADLIQAYLNSYDVKVLRIDKSVASYQTGCEIVNKANPDLCICIHTNASGLGATGTETYYNPDIDGAKQWAELIQNRVKSIRPSIDRGTKDGSYPNGANIGYINRIECVNCLVEMEFHDVYETAKWIFENKNKLAQAITQAIVEQLNLQIRQISNFKTGDKVRIKKNTKYVTGQTPSSWVFDEIFKISRVYEDYAALSGLDNDIIIGTVYYRDLEKISDTQLPKTYLTVSTLFLPLWLCGGWNGTKPTTNLVKMPKGSTVELLEKSNDKWYKVKYNEITGYASASYLK